MVGYIAIPQGHTRRPELMKAKQVEAHTTNRFAYVENNSENTDDEMSRAKFEYWHKKSLSTDSDVSEILERSGSERLRETGSPTSLCRVRDCCKENSSPKR